jgi:multidrug efflux system membrane fusion protein
MKAQCAVNVIVAALVVACKSEPPKRGPQATPVRVATVSRIDAPVTILASGVVEPLQTVAVTSQVSGTLLDVAFKEGDLVQKGQVLFHIDPRPLQATLDQTRATLARDEAQAEAGRKDDERYRRLADMGYVSRSQADQMHATAVAQAATVEADRAAVRAATVNLGFATIRAPISGRTGSLLVRQGNNVSPGGTPLVVINQISPVLVRFPILSQDFPTLQRAVALRPVPVHAAGSDSTQATEMGTLDFLDNAIDSLTGTVTGKAQFPNASRRLWPGELVFLTVDVAVQHGVLAVPTTAIQTGQQGSFVYVVDRQNRATTRVVAAGIQVGGLTVVQSGLNVGDRVVTDGQSRLNPGSRVAIVGTGGDTAATRLGAVQGGTTGIAGGEVSRGGSANQPSNGRANGPAATGVGGNRSAARGSSLGTESPGGPSLPPPVRSPTTTIPSTTTPGTTPATRPPSATGTTTRPPAGGRS